MVDVAKAEMLDAGADGVVIRRSVTLFALTSSGSDTDRDRPSCSTSFPSLQEPIFGRLCIHLLYRAVPPMTMHEVQDDDAGWSSSPAPVPAAPSRSGYTVTSKSRVRTSLHSWNTVSQARPRRIRMHPAGGRNDDLESRERLIQSLCLGIDARRLACRPSGLACPCRCHHGHARQSGRCSLGLPSITFYAVRSLKPSAPSGLDRARLHNPGLLTQPGRASPHPARHSYYDLRPTPSHPLIARRATSVTLQLHRRWGERARLVIPRGPSTSPLPSLLGRSATSS